MRPAGVELATSGPLRSAGTCSALLLNSLLLGQSVKAVARLVVVVTPQLTSRAAHKQRIWIARFARGD